MFILFSFTKKNYDFLLFETRRPLTNTKFVR